MRSRTNRVPAWSAALFLLSGHLLAILGVPGIALAQPAVNLAWDDCYAGGGVADKFDACDTNLLPPHRLLVTINPNGTIAGVSGATGSIIVTVDPAISDYWQLYPGGHRQNAFAEDPLVGISNPPFSCTPIWSDPVSAIVANAPSPANRMRMQWNVLSQPGVTTTLDSSVSTEYYVLAVLISRAGTTTSTQCPDPGLLSVEDVVLLRPAGHPDGDVAVTATDVSTVVSWQGAPTPARYDTWGSIKSLYR